MKVLVGYATEHGSTRVIAERIGARIQMSGVEAEVHPLTGAATDGYDAFVLGSAVHGQAWLAPAVYFVDTEAHALADRPLWLFSVGMPAALRGAWKGFAEREAPRILDDLGHDLHPRDHHLFSGVIAHDHLTFTGRLMFRAVGGHYGDFRDWAVVDAWADDIAHRLSELTAGR